MKFTIIHKIMAGVLLTSITTALIVLPLTVGSGSVENKPETENKSGASNKNENKSETSTEDPKAVEVQGAKSNYVYLYAISNDIVQKESKKIDHKNKNFQCKFDVTTSFDCEISKLKPNDKKQYKLGKVESLINDRPTKEELSQEGQIFQIKFKGTHWNQVPFSKDNFEIIYTESNEKKYFHSYKWFATYNEEKKGLFNSFIIQSKQDVLIDKYPGCEHSDDFSRSSYSWEKCYLYKFNEEEQASTDFSSLTFKPIQITSKNQQTYNTFKKGQYYLVLLSNIKNVEEDFSKIYFVDDPYVNPKKQMFEGSKRTKAFYSEKYDHIFILE